MKMRRSQFALLVTASATTSRSAAAFSILASSATKGSVSASNAPSLIYRPSDDNNNSLRMMSSSSPAELAASLANAATIPLRNGMAHPSVGFGTYKVGFIHAFASAVAAGTQRTSDSRAASEYVKHALDCGYQFLECAEFYGNEHEVGTAIASSGIPREDLCLCSKIWTTAIEEGPEAVEARLEKTLKDLGTDYIDLYVILYCPPVSFL